MKLSIQLVLRARKANDFGSSYAVHIGDNGIGQMEHPELSMRLPPTLH